MSQFNMVLNRIMDILFEPLSKIILSYTKFFKDLMKVFININSYISRYYVPRKIVPQTSISAPIEGVREEFFEPLQRIYAQPRISYTINLLRNIVAGRQAKVPEHFIRHVIMPESLSEAYKIVGESTSYIMQAEKSVGQYTIGTGYIAPEKAIKKELKLEEKIVPETRRISETKPIEETITSKIETAKVYDETREEKILELRQELGEPFKYISSLVNILTQLGSQLPETRYIIPKQFIMPEEVFTKYYISSPLIEFGEKLESVDYRFIQSLAKKTFTEFGELEKNIPSPIRETIIHPLHEYKNILSIPYILSYFILATQVPKLQEILSKTFSDTIKQALLEPTALVNIEKDRGIETIKSAFTSTPLTHYIHLLAKEYPFYTHRLSTTVYSQTLPYTSLDTLSIFYTHKAIVRPYTIILSSTGLSPHSIIGKVYTQTSTVYPPAHDILKFEDFTRKAVYTKVLNILETFPALAQETEAIKYFGLEAYYPLSTISKNILQNLIQLYDRLLYDVKVVRPAEPSPMMTTVSQFLETSRIFRIAEEEARRETLSPTIRQPYTIQPTHPSQSLMEHEIQNIFNITVPEGAELDLWELERKITQILREQFRRYYGPIF
ncbi:MAG: hypothetical protein N3F64_02765 [Nitrososphaeria archaeon]|nr:hypothetical protein [Nitrososphaeria archaeon]